MSHICGGDSSNPCVGSKVAKMMNENGMTPLMRASWKGQSAVLDSLLEAGVNVNNGGEYGFTPLMCACCKGHTKIAERLLNANANPNWTCEFGTTSLHIAASEGNTDLVNLLLTHRADPTVQNRDSETPLEVAKNSEVCRVILDSCNGYRPRPIQHFSSKGKQPQCSSPYHDLPAGPATYLFWMAVGVGKDSYMFQSYGVYPYDCLEETERIFILNQVAEAMSGYKSDLHCNVLNESALFAVFSFMKGRIQNELQLSASEDFNSDDDNTVENAFLWRKRVLEAYEQVFKTHANSAGLAVECLKRSVWNTVINLLARSLFQESFWEKKRMFMSPNVFERRTFLKSFSVPDDYFNCSLPGSTLINQASVQLTFKKLMMMSNTWLREGIQSHNGCFCPDCVAEAEVPLNLKLQFLDETAEQKSKTKKKKGKDRKPDETLEPAIDSATLDALIADPVTELEVRKFWLSISIEEQWAVTEMKLCELSHFIRQCVHWEALRMAINRYPRFAWEEDILELSDSSVTIADHFLPEHGMTKLIDAMIQAVKKKSAISFPGIAEDEYDRRGRRMLENVVLYEFCRRLGSLFLHRKEESRATRAALLLELELLQEEDQHSRVKKSKKKKKKKKGGGVTASSNALPTTTTNDVSATKTDNNTKKSSTRGGGVSEQPKQSQVEEVCRIRTGETRNQKATVEHEQQLKLKQKEKEQEEKPSKKNHHHQQQQQHTEHHRQDRVQDDEDTEDYDDDENDDEQSTWLSNPFAALTKPQKRKKQQSISNTRTASSSVSTASTHQQPQAWESISHSKKNLSSKNAPIESSNDKPVTTTTAPAENTVTRQPSVVKSTSQTVSAATDSPLLNNRPPPTRSTRNVIANPSAPPPTPPTTTTTTHPTVTAVQGQLPQAHAQLQAQAQAQAQNQQQAQILFQTQAHALLQSFAQRIHLLRPNSNPELVAILQAAQVQAQQQMHAQAQSIAQCQATAQAQLQSQAQAQAHALLHIQSMYSPAAKDMQPHHYRMTAEAENQLQAQAQEQAQARAQAQNHLQAQSQDLLQSLEHLPNAQLQARLQLQAQMQSQSQNLSQVHVQLQAQAQAQTQHMPSVSNDRTSETSSCTSDDAVNSPVFMNYADMVKRGSSLGSQQSPAAEDDWSMHFVDGVIFHCNTETVDEAFRRKLFGLPAKYLPLVQSISPQRTALFLLNVSSHFLFGVYQAASSGAKDIVPSAFASSSSSSTSPFPAQVEFTIAHEFPRIPESLFRQVIPDSRLLKLSQQQVRALIQTFIQNQKAHPHLQLPTHASNITAEPPNKIPAGGLFTHPHLQGVAQRLALSHSSASQAQLTSSALVSSPSTSTLSSSSSVSQKNPWQSCERLQTADVVAPARGGNSAFPSLPSLTGLVGAAATSSPSFNSCITQTFDSGLAPVVSVSLSSTPSTSQSSLSEHTAALSDDSQHKSVKAYESTASVVRPDGSGSMTVPFTSQYSAFEVRPPPESQVVSSVVADTWNDTASTTTRSISSLKPDSVSSFYSTQQQLLQQQVQQQPPPCYDDDSNDILNDVSLAHLQISKPPTVRQPLSAPYSTASSSSLQILSTDSSSRPVSNPPLFAESLLSQQQQHIDKRTFTDSKMLSATQPSDMNQIIAGGIGASALFGDYVPAGSQSQLAALHSESIPLDELNRRDLDPEQNPDETLIPSENEPQMTLFGNWQKLWNAPASSPATDSNPVASDSSMWTPVSFLSSLTSFSSPSTHEDIMSSSKSSNDVTSSVSNKCQDSRAKSNSHSVSREPISFGSVSRGGQSSAAVSSSFRIPSFLSNRTDIPNTSVPENEQNIRPPVVEYSGGRSQSMTTAQQSNPSSLTQNNGSWNWNPYVDQTTAVCSNVPVFDSWQQQQPLSQSRPVTQPEMISRSFFVPEGPPAIKQHTSEPVRVNKYPRKQLPMPSTNDMPLPQGRLGMTSSTSCLGINRVVELPLPPGASGHTDYSFSQKQQHQHLIRQQQQQQQQASYSRSQDHLSFRPQPSTQSQLHRFGSGNGTNPVIGGTARNRMPPPVIGQQQWDATANVPMWDNSISTPNPHSSGQRHLPQPLIQTHQPVNPSMPQPAGVNHGFAQRQPQKQQQQGSRLGGMFGGRIW